MEKLFYFFDMDYETIIHPPDTPFRLLLESVGYVGLHWHRDLELILMLKGEVTVTNSRAMYQLKPGDLLLINSNEMHSYVEKSDNLMLVLQVKPEVFQSGTDEETDRSYILDNHTLIEKEALSKLRKSIARLSLERWEKKRGYEFYCRSAIYEIAGILRRHIPSLPHHSDENKDNVKQARIKAIMDYLQSHSRQKTSLGEMASQMNLSPYYLSHLIKEGTGWSWQENLNLIRTGNAVVMMLKTEKSLLEISVASGFSDPKYFNQYFKKLFGMTPRQLKRQPDWKQAVLNYFSHEGLDPEYGMTYVKELLQDNHR